MDLPSSTLKVTEKLKKKKKGKEPQPDEVHQSFNLHSFCNTYSMPS